MNVVRRLCMRLEQWTKEHNDEEAANVIFSHFLFVVLKLYSSGWLAECVRYASSAYYAKRFVCDTQSRSNYYWARRRKMFCFLRKCVSHTASCRPHTRTQSHIIFVPNLFAIECMRRMWQQCDCRLVCSHSTHSIHLLLRQIPENNFIFILYYDSAKLINIQWLVFGRIHFKSKSSFEMQIIVEF